MLFKKQILNAYKGMMHTRCDDTETVFYFTADDFAGLHCEPYAFCASLGHTLQGYLYFYDNPMDGRMIVFDHGLGGGHRAYMREIEMLCRHGYLVLSYDHTGCMESGGISTNGLTQSLCDLNDCICAIRSDNRFADRSISVMGHSWGAFSTLNITALHPDVTHIVALCGFVSAEEMIKTLFGGLLKGYRRALLALEREANPSFVSYHAVETLSKSDVKALLIYSEDDMLCRRKHYDLLKEALGGKANVHFLLEKHKGHNPNYTEDAVKLLQEFGQARAKLLRKKHLTKEEKARFATSYDWKRMTEQDAAVWKEIFAHLDAQP